VGADNVFNKTHAASFAVSGSHTAPLLAALERADQIGLLGKEAAGPATSFFAPTLFDCAVRKRFFEGRET
jgi:hypothetical protein